jgi:hypothetical protein
MYTTDYHLFKDGIQPMWEDPDSKQGYIPIYIYIYISKCCTLVIIIIIIINVVFIRW